MISRQWRGLAKRSHAEKYTDHLRQDTFPKLQKISGFISGSILRRNIPNGVEFLIVTIWESVDAIKRFAGTDVETAIVPLSVQEMMVDYDNRVRHYEIVL